MSHASKEAFAAFLDYSDDQIGRFVDGLRRLGRLDKTIIIVLADNGASQEGGPFGVLHEMKFFNGIIESPDDAIARLDEIGGPDSHTDYPWGWAQCGNTPYRWYKQNAHEGGVHVPMVVHWPAGVAPDQSDTLREQFVFASDIAATIYDLLGIEAPLVRNGVDQLPVAGHSFAAALADPSAPATNDVQYFEKGGSRDLSAGEWKAVCKHVAGADYDTEAWELYHLSVDRSECDDLAGTLLAILAELWWREADRHGVLPLEDRGIELFGARFRDRSPHPLSRRYVYRPPMSPLPGQAGAAIGGRSFDLIARVTLSDGDEGVLFATGTRSAGLSMFVAGSRLAFDYNAFGTHTTLESGPLVLGNRDLSIHLRRGDGMSGTAAIAVDGEHAGAVALRLFMRMMSSIGPRIGSDHGSPVAQRYDSPFAFTGVLHEVVIQASPEYFGDTRAVEGRAEESRQ